MFVGLKTLAVNTASKMLSSTIGHLLHKKQPPIGILWYESAGEYNVSLRSNGTVDVSKLAKKFGGGGHSAAAGFTIPISQKLPWKKIT
jgi:nanoRNase/pAp phosphatase (c-di-AMP/oligoRNAs hydrolase)